MLLCALGTYIGRYLGFNNRDIIKNPIHVSNDIFLMLIIPYATGMDGE